MTAATVYLSAAQRNSLIDEYVYAWLDTESYLDEENADQEAAAVKCRLEVLSNPELYRELKASGWHFRTLEFRD